MKILSVLIALALLPVVFAGITGTAPIPPAPNWYINSGATTVCRGEVNYIPIVVGNAGSGLNFQMQNVQIEPASQRGIYYLSSNGVLVLGNINVSQSVNVLLPVFISANVSSFYSLGISLNYYFGNGQYQDTEIKNITFASEVCPQQLQLNVTPLVLTAGDMQNISIAFTNTGRTPLSSINAHFNIPGSDGSWLSTQPIEISSIAPLSTTIMNARIYVSRNASQNIPLNMTVIYYNGTNPNQIAESLQELSSGIVDMSPSSFTISPSIPTQQSIFSISFVLTDTGTSGADALTATVLPPKGFTSFGSNSVFVGDIQVDTQTPVTLSMIASNAVAAGTYNIPIRINYLNNLRENETSWANTSVTIGYGTFNATSALRYRTSSSGGGGGGLIIIILVIVVAALGYLLYKEKKDKGRAK